MKEFAWTNLVPDHVPKDHPLVTQKYSLFTNSISELGNVVGHWLDNEFEGATIYGPSRFGKSNAVDNWLQALLSQRYGGHVPMVIWSHSDSGGGQSSGRFYSNLLAASKHHLARATRSPQARQTMLIERFVELASVGGGHFVVLVIDESQQMSQREWLWMVQFHSLLDKERVRLCVLSIASVQFRDDPVNLAVTGGAHVAARFMLAAKRFYGVRSLDELAMVMDGYDVGTEWPERSGLSFTEGIAPDAWSRGFRMKRCANVLWQSMIDELPDRYDGPIDFPMKTIAMVSRQLLLRVAGGFDIDGDNFASEVRDMIATTGHKTLMAIVSAGAPRKQ